MNNLAIYVLFPCIIATICMACGRLVHDQDQHDISEIIAEGLRESMNPFAPNRQINYVRIHIVTASNGIGYAINDRPMPLDKLDESLGKLAQIDRQQTLIVELGEGVAPDDLTPLIALLKKHQFRHVARRGENNTAIWIME